MTVSVLLINGKTENVYGDEDFARLLRDRLGDDAARYFLDTISDHAKNPEEFGYECSGECDRVYETQENYERILKDVRDELASWPTRKMTKADIDAKRDRLIEKIGWEL